MGGCGDERVRKGGVGLLPVAVASSCSALSAEMGIFCGCQPFSHGLAGVGNRKKVDCMPVPKPVPSQDFKGFHLGLAPKVFTWG